MPVGGAVPGRRGPLHPAVAAVRSAVRAVLAEITSEGDGVVLVACSGGPDSLALAAATAHEAPRAGCTAGAVVVDHGWHEGSAAVAREAARACLALGLHPVEVVDLEGPGVRGPGVRGPSAPAGAAGRRRGGGAEAVARAARYAALEGAAARHGAGAVLLGHTADDQAEQVLLGLARGSGARSLAGMPARRGPYRRPLLGVTRATTTAACTALGLRPWRDPSNDDPAHARARVRHALLPALEAELGPGVAAALVRTADQLREDADVLGALAADLLQRAACASGPGTASPEPGVDPPALALDVPVLAGAPAALRTRALRMAAVRVGCPPSDLTREHVLALQRLVTHWHGQGPLHLPGAVGATRSCGRLALWTRRTWGPTSTRSS